MDSDDPTMFAASSPVRNKVDRKRKGRQARKDTFEKKRVEREEQAAREQQEAEVAEAANAKAERERRTRRWMHVRATPSCSDSADPPPTPPNEGPASIRRNGGTTPSVVLEAGSRA